jgi:hypothetical protein
MDLTEQTTYIIIWLGKCTDRYTNQILEYEKHVL